MGCNTFDLAHVYGSQVECLFGKWMSTRTALELNSSGLEDCCSVEIRDADIASTRRLSRQDLFLMARADPFRNSRYKARLSADELDGSERVSIVLAELHRCVFASWDDRRERFQMLVQ